MKKIKEFLIRGISPMVTIIIVALIGILTTAGILAYIYLWHPAEPQAQQSVLNDSKTANWKTYRNEELGFEVKYPSGWNFVEDNTYSTKEIARNNALRLDISFSTSPTTTDIQEKTNNQYLSLIISEQNSEPIVCSESQKEVALGTVKGCKLIEIRKFSEGSGGYNPQNLWSGFFDTKNNKYTYSFYYLAGLETTNAEDIFEKIVSTFKFIPVSTNSTAYKEEFLIINSLGIKLPINKNLDGLSFRESSPLPSETEFSVPIPKEILELSAQQDKDCSSATLGWLTKETSIPDPEIGGGPLKCFYKCNFYLCFWQTQASICDYPSVWDLEIKSRDTLLESLNNAECI